MSIEKSPGGRTTTVVLYIAVYSSFLHRLCRWLQIGNEVLYTTALFFSQRIVFFLSVEQIKGCFMNLERNLGLEELYSKRNTAIRLNFIAGPKQE